MSNTLTLTLRHGDCVDVLAGMGENSIGAIVSDPPYGLEFMGAAWDAPWQGKAAPEFNTIKQGTLGGFSSLPNHSRVNNTRCVQCGRWRFSGTPCTCPNPQFPNARLQAMQLFEHWSLGWFSEAYRVLVPGGVVKAFSGTRTFHRMTAAMQDAGFTDIQIEAWGYGSGFPKSLDVSKAIDKAAGAEREVVGARPIAYADSDCWGTPNASSGGDGHGYNGGWKGINRGDERPVTAPATDAARTWDGWGTALKPSWEPVIVGRKPRAGE